MARPEGGRFDSWKEIAAYLDHNIRTARRWEKERGLPVHRVPGGGRSAVFAYRSEIDAWLRNTALVASGNVWEHHDPQGFDPRVTNRDLDQPTAAAVTPTIRTAPPKEGFLPGNPGSTKRLFTSRALTVGVVGFLLLIGGAYGLTRFIGVLAARAHSAPARSKDSKTKIERVTPVHAQVTQAIIIEGEGFGPPPRTILNVPQEGGIDTLGGSYATSLAIEDMGGGAHHWIAGRASEINMCKIGVRLESWTETRIVLAGFAGPLGTHSTDSYQIAAGDRLRFIVYGPLNMCGPAGFQECLDEVKDGRLATYETIVIPSARAAAAPAAAHP